jgi:hypothetical protein
MRANLLDFEIFLCFCFTFLYFFLNKQGLFLTTKGKLRPSIRVWAPTGPQLGFPYWRRVPKNCLANDSQYTIIARERMGSTYSQNI